VLVSRRYILNNYRKHLPERLDTERTQPPAAWIAVTPKHVDVARQILEAKHWIVPYSSARSAPAAVLRYFASWQCAHAKRSPRPR
jgi:hypothetical protein